MYNLSEKAIAEKYEDLLFTKVMALYAAEESEKILSEIENEEPADPKNIEKIYSKTERRENFSTLWKVSKKLIPIFPVQIFNTKNRAKSPIPFAISRDLATCPSFLASSNFFCVAGSVFSPPGPSLAKY